MKNDKKRDDENNYQSVRDLKTLSGKDDSVEQARDEALDDIEQDPDLSIHHPNDDLDEGETARLGEDKTDLV